MKNNLLPIITLPYKVVRGSVQYRQNKADKLVDDFYKNINQKFKNGYIKTPEIQKAIDETLPKKLGIILDEGESATEEAWSEVICSRRFDHINKMTLGVKKVKRKRLPIEYLPTILHEFQHISDCLFHPKYLSRTQNMNLKKLDTEKFDNFFDENFYIFEWPESKAEKKDILKRIKMNLKKFLKGQSTSNKIDYIQEMRYTLQQEKKAFHTQYKYTKKLRKKGINFRKEDSKNYNDIIMFDEKLKLLKDVALEIIKKERGLHAARIKKQKLRNVKNDKK